MGCNSSYMDATQMEKNLSVVYGLLDELETGKLPENFGDGYDSRTYNKGLNQSDLDKATKTLCSKLKKTDVSKYSLEMQIWWRDHQKADKERLAKEKEEKEMKAVAKKALAKLTPKEKKALGLK